MNDLTDQRQTNGTAGREYNSEFCEEFNMQYVNTNIRLNNGISGVLSIKNTMRFLGGVLLVGPTYTRESFVNHQVEHDQRRCGDLTLTYLSYIHDPDPSDSTFEMVLSIIHNIGGQVRLIEDRHRCGLFTLDRWRAMLDGSGFDAELVTDDLPWTLFVAIKRSNS